VKLTRNNIIRQLDEQEAFNGLQSDGHQLTALFQAAAAAALVSKHRFVLYSIRKQNIPATSLLL